MKVEEYEAFMFLSPKGERSMKDVRDYSGRCAYCATQNVSGW